ncbi:TetR/AcrR family transcriptional regulator [Yinghuangia seranimata]|uniref:TetR/AcrR family transcriptional regulator n=1 Tax=Yinghuangia seranimata TaxID=408067 RepID=UPI00248CB971|nr:TetR/AcrR family transcriptional regulator [Yinghuangia seranimata]MDI2130766.1 TetR family transcriptional regulator [Yinghuangia seranimata]
MSRSARETGAGDTNPRNGNSSGEATRAKLLRTAERLFAKNGIDGVSVRDITGTAGANSAAVHYHFGSKQDLIAAILHRRMEALGARREQLLADLEADEKPELRDVVAALLLPTVELSRDRRGGGHHYLGFLVAVGEHPTSMHLITDELDPLTARYLSVLERALPEVPRDVILFRFGIAKDLVNRVLRQGAVREWLRRHASDDEKVLFDQLVDFLAGAFAAPARAF